MRSVEDIEHYLLRLGLPYEEVGEHTWVIHDQFEQIENIVIKWSPPLVIFRVKLMELNGVEQGSLFRRLLELNASDMVAGAFGVEGNSIVVVDTLQADNLDYNEFEASVDALTMAIATHYRELTSFRKDH